jgi:hypothetical protein
LSRLNLPNRIQTLLDNIGKEGNKKSASGALFSDFLQFILEIIKKNEIGVDNADFGLILFIVKIR